MDSLDAIDANKGMSLRQKSLLKQKTSKEHNSNFRAGYVQINEDYLHKSGIRGRKMYCLWCAAITLLLVAVANLLVTVIIILVLRIDFHGMDSLEFVRRGVLLKFKKAAHLGTLIPQDGRVGSFADSDLHIEATNQTIKMTVANNGDQKSSVSVHPEKTEFLTSGMVHFTNPETGKTFFTPTWDDFKLPKHVNTFSAEVVEASTVSSPSNKDLRIESNSTVTLQGNEGVHMEGRRIHWKANNIQLQSNEKISLHSEEGIYINIGSLPKEDGNSSFDAPAITYQLCACVRNGQSYRLFRVPVFRPGLGCATANEEVNPCD